MGVIETKRVINKSGRRRRMTKRRRTIQLCVRAGAGVLAIAAVCLGIYFLIFAGYTRIDIRDYTTASLYGYNGHGSLDIQVSPIPGEEEFFDTLQIQYDNSNNLSNGDEVKITYSYDNDIAKRLGLKVKGKSEYVTVKNLPEAKPVSYEELFADVKVTFEGVAPLVTATLENTSTDELLSNISYEIDNPKDFYDIGDVVTVKAIFDEEAVRQNAYEIEPGTNGYQKDYIVENVDRYITDVSELPPELLQEMKDNAETLFGTAPGDANEFGLSVFCDAGIRYDLDADGKYTFRYTGSSFISAYFNTVTDEFLGENGTHVNGVMLVYDTGIKQSTGESVAAEAVVVYTNIVEHTDGTVDLDIDSGYITSCSRSDKNIKELVHANGDEKYNSVKIEP